MDGRELQYRLRQLLNESASSAFLDAKTSYSFLWQAAIDFAERTGCLRATQVITTVANQSGYAVAPDFLRLYDVRDRNENNVVKYNDGSTNSFLPWKSYGSIITEDNTTAVSVPSFFSLVDSALLSQVSGTATSAGAASGGQCTLVASAADFTNVAAGDYIHNTTDVSDGVVLSKTNTTTLVTALFGGSGNDWAISDAFVIQPQGRFQLELNPPPSVSNHTVTLYYVQRPLPVFSNFGMYRFPSQFNSAIIAYAAWMYKYRDREPNFGDKWYQLYERDVRRASALYRDSVSSNSLSVSFRKR